MKFFALWMLFVVSIFFVIVDGMALNEQNLIAHISGPEHVHSAKCARGRGSPRPPSEMGGQTVPPTVQNSTTTVKPTNSTTG